MNGLLITIHIIISFILVVLILSQTSKGDNLGGTFGGVTPNVLGINQVSSFLKKWTKVFIVLFVLSCFAMAYYIGHAKGESNSAIKKIQKEMNK